MPNWTKEELAAHLAKPKRGKYGAIKTQVDGITFHSKKEAERYRALKILRNIHSIRDLKLQPKFYLEVNGVPVCTYIADFSYYRGDQLVVEDVKGFKTPAYRLKKKLVKALYGIEVVEV